ncbi:MAG: SseB family protein [Lachnospiraceae bacterium]|nr:SseB family protein [Lachnospiraceae bacterium]MDD5853490.1 SseB family protein [Lachnospiraceae bacterium]
MKFKKEELHNEALISSIQKFGEEVNADTQRNLLDEVLKSRLWLPARVTPAPIKTPKGEYVVTSKHKVHMVSAHQTVKGQDTTYYIAFTDKDAYKTWANGKKHDIFTADFDEIAVMLLRPTAVCKGVIINPGTDNIRLTTEAVKQSIVHRDKVAAGEIEEDAKDEGKEE